MSSLAVGEDYSVGAITNETHQYCSSNQGGFSMRTRTILLIGTLLFLCFAGIRANLTAAQGNSAGANTKAQGKPTPYPTYNVTSTVYDFDSLSNPLQLQSDDLNPNLTGTGGLDGVYKT